MFRPSCMAIFRFSVQYSVRRFLFLVWSGGEARSHFTMYGWYRSDVWCVLGALPGLGLLLLSVRGALHMGDACEIIIYNNLYYL
jgi:hypothetical protein